MRRRNYQRDAAFFRGSEVRRILMMIFLLLVLGMAVRQTADPASWRWLAHDASASESPNTADAAAAAEVSAVAQPQEVAKEQKDPVATEASEDDPEELAAAGQQFEAVSDRSPLVPEEMPAYWRLVKWAGQESFAELQRRGRQGVLYTQFWEEPASYRGKPIVLKLHLRRVLSHDAPANSAGATTVYEGWGFTDESKSLPYVVVFTERPAGLPLGANIHEEVEFAGYFLKNMAYQAFDKQRGAPLLIGRIERRAAPVVAIDSASQRNWFWWTLGLGGAVLLMLFAIWAMQRTPRSAKSAELPEAEPRGEFDEWLRHVEQSGADESGQDARNSGV